jgi:hypothetical protein
MDSKSLVKEIQDFLQTALMLEKRKLPWNVGVGDCLFRFDLDRALLSNWKKEIEQLIICALQVRVAILYQRTKPCVVKY